MPRSRPISLRDAVQSGASEILIYCEAMGCDHVSAISIETAVIRWGLDRKLDDVTPSCAGCGSRMIEARFAWPTKT